MIILWGIRYIVCFEPVLESLTDKELFMPRTPSSHFSRNVGSAKPQIKPTQAKKKYKKNSSQGGKNGKNIPKKSVLAKAESQRSNRLNAVWLLRCAPGLAKLLIAEMRYRKYLPRQRSPLILRQRGHDLLFLTSIAKAPDCRTFLLAEEHFRCLAYGRFKISARQLDAVAQAMADLSAGFRLLVTVDGDHFQRRDVIRFVRRELEKRGKKVIEGDAGDGDKALWCFCIGQDFYFARRESISALAAHRQERRAEREAALPPTIAAAMVFLGKPNKKDRILDPCCGSGTLLAEAKAQAPEATVWGYDLDENAIKIARQNLHIWPEMTLAHSDGTQTPLPPETIDLFLANFPFGNVYGASDTNPALYEAFLQEMTRIGRQKWRAVILTSDRDALASAMARHSQLKITHHQKVHIRGQMAEITIITPENTGITPENQTKI